MKKKVFILGAGGHGRVLYSVLRDNDELEVACFVDENLGVKGKKVNGLDVYNSLNDINKKDISGGIGGVGDNDTRSRMAKDILDNGFDLINAIDNSCIIKDGVSLGQGVTIWAGVIINFYSKIGDNVIINCGAIIEHECVIGKSAHIGPGAKLAGVVEVGEYAFVGMGAVIKEGIKIGRNSIVGAGSVVIKDVPAGVTVVGVPAKVINKK
jgi:UDP-perosamine 4-acetyltransferase